MSLPKLSIITATFNRREKLERAIRSVLAQANKNYELLIIDDGSSDGTDKMIQSFTAANPHILYTAFAENRGVNAARTKGIEQARAPWVLFLDSDNQLATDALEKLIPILENPASAPILFFPCLLPSGQPLTTVAWDKPQVSYPEYLSNRFWGEFTPLIRRDFLLRYPFIPGIQGGERIIWSMILRECVEGSVQTFPLTIYDNSGTDRLSHRWQNIRRIKQTYVADLRHLWREYLKVSPLRLLALTSRIAFYQLLEWGNTLRGVRS